MGSGLEKGRDIADCLLELSSSVLGIARRLPKDRWGRHIAFQVVTSSTSSGANYEEARAAESRADFVHKVSVSVKELRETIYWLRFIAKSFTVGDLSVPLDEANQLCAILVASKRTAIANTA